MKSLPRCTELDLQTSLSRVCGNEKLLRNLLVLMHQHYKTAPQKIKSALESEDLELAIRLVHTMKGMPGNLGAHRLATSAEKMEAALIEGKVAELSGFMDKFNEAVLAISNSINDFITIKEQAVAKKIENEKVDLQTLAALLGDLNTLITKKMPFTSQAQRI